MTPTIQQIFARPFAAPPHLICDGMQILIAKDMAKRVARERKKLGIPPPSLPGAHNRGGTTRSEVKNRARKAIEENAVIGQRYELKDVRKWDPADKQTIRYAMLAIVTDGRAETSVIKGRTTFVYWGK